MADRRRSKNGGFLRNAVFMCLILFTSFLPVAECNYEALFDYEREKHLDTFDTYVVEDDVKRIDLDQPIYFYGQKFSALQISKDGTVSFGEDVVNFKRNPQWPQGFTELTSSSDKPFIAAFHYDGYASASPQTYHGRIYWSKYERQLRDEDLTEDARRYEAFLDYLGKYLSHSSVTVTSFQPHVYVMVTWENVTDHATTNTRNISCSADFDNPCPSATFQLVIAADFQNTFVIFNYAKMDLPYRSTHLEGMNGGRGRGWTDVVMCAGPCRKNKQYRSIPHLLPTLQGSSSDGQSSGLSGSRPSSSQVLGRFIFVVADDIVVRGGCLPHGIKGSGYMDTVEVSPHQVEMMGGDIIKVSGQCQEPYSTIYCRFDSQEVTEGKITAGMVGWCPVPRLTRRGHVKLEVSSDPDDWRVYTYIIAMPPGHVEMLSDRLDMQPWFRVDPDQLTVTWNSTQLSRDSKVTVDVVLVQYRESGDQVSWKDLVKLAEKVSNSGSFRFDPNSDERFRCREYCDDIQLGLVEIRVTEDDREAANEKQYIAIGPLPLAWYVNYVKKEQQGTEWYQDQCERWARQEREDINWQAELPPCPCTLQQALADWGRWQADVSCSLFNKNSKCAFHKGAKHCVRSVHPTSQAAGSLCCYDNDNNLMYAADSYEGSMSSRAHAWGAAPYNRPGRVPAWSHWLQDLVPYYQCCQWSDRDQYCQFYAERRPTKDCRFYDPPGSAIIYGDPHVRTFDDERYHFGGAGDFWLVRSPGLSLEARFLERQISAVVHTENTLLPTYISSAAVKGPEGSDTVVTFTMAPPDDLHPRRLDVMVNRLHYFFDTPQNRWLDFAGLTIINTETFATSADDRYHSNFTVLLESGAGVQVAERAGLIHVVVLLPPLPRQEDGQTIREPASKGLLGSWDEKKTNDYMTPDGNYVPSTEDDYIKYKDFALRWAVEDAEESLFPFIHPVTDRLPILGSLTTLLDPNLTPSDGEVMAVCGTTDLGNPCAYDYFVTGNRTLATSTRTALEAFDSLRRSQKKIWSCGWLPIPFAIKDHTNYSAGNTVRVTGCRTGRDSSGSVQGGPTDYTCVQNETEHQPFWDPYDDINHYLCTDTESASLAMIIGIAVALVVVIAIVAVVAFIFYKRRSRNETVTKKRPASRDEAARDGGTDEKLVRRKPRDEGSYPMDERRTLEV